LAAAEHPGFLHKSEVDMEPLVVETLRRWSPTPRRWTLGEIDEATVDADLDRFQLALDALIENAVKHTGSEDAIELTLSREADMAVVAVSDTGSGIPPEVLDRIFDRFARADPARNRDRGGVGLGLSLVRAIAEAHGGSVRVQSTLGRGSSFELRLPLAPARLGEDRAGAALRPTDTVPGQIPVS